MTKAEDVLMSPLDVIFSELLKSDLFVKTFVLVETFVLEEKLKNPTLLPKWFPETRI